MGTQIELWKPNTPESYLAAALETAKWIRSFAVTKETGKSWKMSSGEGSAENDPLAAIIHENDRNLYSGAAGIGYFFVQLYEITEDPSYLADAIAAGEYLMDTFSEALGDKPGIHMGLAGEGLFTELLYQKTRDVRFREYAVKVGDTIYARAVKDASGLHWYDTCDYMGDGSAITYWVYLNKQTGMQKYLDYAKMGIDYILSVCTYEDESIIYWSFADMHDFFDSIPAGGIIPNFAHGTSGIVYILTKYYEASKDKAYLAYAKKGMKFLMDIAINEDDATIIPYIYYQDKTKNIDLFYLSLCHGPVGTGVTAQELYRATGDKAYLLLFRRLSNALINADVASKRSPGYWNDCVCCGAAGVLLHFISGYQLTGDEQYQSYGRLIADKLIGDSYRDERGTRWYNAWTRVIPWNVDSHLGLYIGAAGEASALLSLYAALNGKQISALYEFQ
jgi:lantibiotic modifying enzyme